MHSAKSSHAFGDIAPGTLVPIENAFTSSLVEYYRDKLPPPIHVCIEELAQARGSCKSRVGPQ